MSLRKACVDHGGLCGASAGSFEGVACGQEQRQLSIKATAGLARLCVPCYCPFISSRGLPSDFSLLPQTFSLTSGDLSIPWKQGSIKCKQSKMQGPWNPLSLF